MLTHMPQCGTRHGAPICTCGAIDALASRLVRDHLQHPGEARPERAVTPDQVRRALNEAYR